jgi:hypothetical protein
LPLFTGPVLLWLRCDSIGILREGAQVAFISVVAVVQPSFQPVAAGLEILRGHVFLSGNDE